MATYEEVINGNINSLKELKDLIKSFKDELATAKEGTQEWEDACDGLAVAQERVDKINQAAKGTLDSLNVSAKDSINTLKERIKQLNTERNAMDMNSEAYKAATAELNQLNTKLRNTGVSAGDMKANVGNYAESLSSGFKGVNDAVGKASSKLISGIQGIGQSLGGLSPTLGKITGGFKALAGAAGGVGIAIAAVTAVIAAFKEGVNSSAENTKKWQEIIAPIQALFAVLKEDLQELTSKVLDFGVALQKNEKAMKVVRTVAQALVTVFLHIKQRVIDVIEVYKAWYERLREIAAKLRDIFNPLFETISRIFRTVKDKLQPVITWMVKVWNDIAKSNVGKLLGLNAINELGKAWQDAGEKVDEYAERMKHVKIGGSGKGSGGGTDIDKDAEALKIRTGWANFEIATKESQILEYNLQLEQERNKETKDYAKILDLTNNIAEEQIGIAELNVSAAKEELEAIRKRNEEHAKNKKPLEDETDAVIKLTKANDALLQTYANEVKALDAVKLEERTQAVKDLEDALKEFDAQYSETMAELKDPIGPPEGPDERIETLNIYYEAVKEKYEAEYEAYRVMTDGKIAELERFVAAQKAAGNETSKQELQIIKLREQQSKEYNKMIASQNAIDKTRKKAVWSNVNSQLQAYSDFFGAMEELYEEDSLNHKIMGTAKALIDTFVAANSVLAQQPGGYITKAIAMAATIAAGIANVIAIWKTDTNNPSVSTSTAQMATATPSVDETPYSYAQTVQTAAAEETINAASEPTKVYVLESDITDAQERAKARVAESEF